MSNNFFPSSRTEALAMLYLQNQDLKGKSPEELQAMYLKAYDALKTDDDSKKETKWTTNPKGIL